MEKELLELLKESDRSSVLRTSGFLKEILEIVKDYREKNDYIKTVRYIKPTELEELSDYSHAEALYSSLDHIVLVNKDVMQTYENRMLNSGPSFSEREQNLMLPLLTLSIMFHEIEHGYQNMKYNLGDDGSLEYKLINACTRYLYKFNDPKVAKELIEKGFTKDITRKYAETLYNKHKKNYKYSPKERMADTRALKTVLDVIEPIKEEIPKLYNFQYYRYLISLTRGYSNIPNISKCPTRLYLERTDNMHIWKATDFYSSDSFQTGENAIRLYPNPVDRFYYGLPVTSSEYWDVSRGALKIRNRIMLFDDLKYK